jgi:hypothetical protein
MATRFKRKRIATALGLQRLLNKAKEQNDFDSLKRVAQKLKIPRIKEWRRLIGDFEEMQRADQHAADVYWNAARSFLEEAGARGFSQMWKAKRLLRGARLKAKETVFGATLYPLSTSIKENLIGRANIEELVEDKSLQQMFVQGGLRNRVLKMAGISRPEMIEVRRAYAAIGIYRFKISKGKKRKVVFVDGTGVEADILAAKCIRGFGIIVPKMENVVYEVAKNQKNEYGLMQDIDQVKGVKRAVSIRGIARDESMSRLVMENFDEFSEKLGFALEVCRMLGIQDRHNRNVFVVEKTNGSLAIGMIDMDVVGCYTDQMEYQEAFAGQLFHLIESLYFAERFGEFVRSHPERIREELDKEPVKKKRAQMLETSQKVLEGFLRGAQTAHSIFLKKKVQKRIGKMFSSHEGKPVGMACDEQRLERKLHILSKKLKEVWVESLERKGYFQTIIKKGCHRGRIRMDLNLSKIGFEQQFSAVDKNNNVVDPSRHFWKRTFRYWQMGLGLWVREDGQLHPIVTAAY